MFTNLTIFRPYILTINSKGLNIIHMGTVQDGWFMISFSRCWWYSLSASSYLRTSPTFFNIHLHHSEFPGVQCVFWFVWLFGGCEKHTDMGCPYPKWNYSSTTLHVILDDLLTNRANLGPSEKLYQTHKTALGLTKHIKIEAWNTQNKSWLSDSCWIRKKHLPSKWLPQRLTHKVRPPIV